VNLPLRRDAEQVADEECLTKRIVFGQPSHSSFPNHMDCFDALQRAPRTLKRAIAFGEPHQFLHDSVILLNGLITNDKFCLSRVSRQKMRYDRG
jgi:hypothetical protein